MTALRRRRRKARAARTSWDPLAASPWDLGTGPLVTPAQGRLGISHSAGLAAGAVTVVHVQPRREFTHPALGADEVWKGDHVERGARVTVGGVPVGVAALWLINPLDSGKRVLIAQLTVV